MKKAINRTIATLLAVVLLCAFVPLMASAAGEATFKRNYYKVRYLSSTQLTYNGTPTRFECAENNLGISVNEKTGRVTSEFCLRKWGFVQMKIFSADGSYDTCMVEVDADLWQWIIIVGLLGWFWY